MAASLSATGVPGPESVQCQCVMAAALSLRNIHFYVSPLTCTVHTKPILQVRLYVQRVRVSGLVCVYETDDCMPILTTHHRALLCEPLASPTAAD
jgi:hypothetical protein